MPEYAVGIDVSRHQGTIDWKAVAASGEIQYAAIRATIGSIYKDPRFIENWNGAKENGILVTAYHVVRWDYPAEAQVKNFLAMLDSVDGDYDLPLVLDVELPVPAGGTDKHQDTITNTSNIALQLGGLSANLPSGYNNSMVYTGKWWWESAYKYWLASHADAFLPQWLWSAAYIPEVQWDEKWYPSAYTPWNYVDVWQFTSKGTVSGIDGFVDKNRIKKTSLFYELYIECKEPTTPPVDPCEFQVIRICSDKPVTIIIEK